MSNPYPVQIEEQLSGEDYRLAEGSFVKTWTSARLRLPLSLIATGSPVRKFRPHPEDVPISRSIPSAMYATGMQ